MTTQSPTNNVIPLLNGDKPAARKTVTKIAELPARPDADEIYYNRRCAGLSFKQAAELVGVHRSTWQRWERGQARMPRSKWAWFLCATGGAMLPGGGDWEGWSINRQGLLDSHSGCSYEMHEIRAIPLLYTRIRHLEQTIRELREKLKTVSTNRVVHDRQRLAGELLAAGNLLISIITNAKDSPLVETDNFFREIAGTGESVDSSSIFEAATSVYEKAAEIMLSVQPLD